MEITREHIDKLKTRHERLRAGAPRLRLMLQDPDRFQQLHDEWSQTVEAEEARRLNAEICRLEEEYRLQQQTNARLTEYELRLGELAHKSFEQWRCESGSVGTEQAHIVNTCKRWTQHALSGDWPDTRIITLILSSPSCGVGKTHLSLSILRELVIAGWSWERWPVVEMLSIFRAANEGHQESARARSVMTRAKEAIVLVLDDLGTHRGTHWELERLYEVLNARIESSKWTIITGNARREEQLARGLEGDGANLHVARIASRLTDRAVILRFGDKVEWPDQRRRAA